MHHSTRNFWLFPKAGPIGEKSSFYGYIWKETRFLARLHQWLRNRVSGENLGWVAKYLEINPVSGEIAPVAQKPGFSQNLGWVAKYLEINPVSLKFHEWLRNRVSGENLGWVAKYLEINPVSGEINYHKLAKTFIPSSFFPSSFFFLSSFFLLTNIR